MYNDYPGCSDSYDTDLSIDESDLLYVVSKIKTVTLQLEALLAERDGFTVLERLHTDIDDARRDRNAQIDRCHRDMERLTATATALNIELLPDDADGYDDDVAA